MQIDTIGFRFSWGRAMPIRQFIALLPVLFMLGCNQKSQQQMLEKFSTPEDQAVAKAYISDLQARKLDVIENDIDSSIKSPDTHAMLVHMAGFLPGGSPTSIKLIGAQRIYNPAGIVTNTTFEYQWNNKWIICNVAVQKLTKTIVGINVYLRKESLEQQNRFTLTGKSPAQYAILAGAVLAFSLTLYALWACIRTKGLARKWLWIIFIVFGFGLLSTNWSTGAVGYQLIYVTLFSAGAFAPYYGPWTIAMSVPVGAVAFLWRRWRLSSGAKVAAGPER
jgi:hypothetical protein